MEATVTELIESSPESNLPELAWTHPGSGLQHDSADPSRCGGFEYIAHVTCKEKAVSARQLLCHDLRCARSAPYETDAQAEKVLDRLRERRILDDPDAYKQAERIAVWAVIPPPALVRGLRRKFGFQKARRALYQAFSHRWMMGGVAIFDHDGSRCPCGIRGAHWEVVQADTERKDGNPLMPPSEMGEHEHQDGWEFRFVSGIFTTLTHAVRLLVEAHSFVPHGEGSKSSSVVKGISWFGDCGYNAKAGGFKAPKPFKSTTRLCPGCGEADDFSNFAPAVLPEGYVWPKGKESVRAPEGTRFIVRDPTGWGPPLEREVAWA